MLRQIVSQLLDFILLYFTVKQVLIVYANPLWKQEHQQLQQFYGRCYQSIILEDDKVSDHFTLQFSYLLFYFFIERMIFCNLHNLHLFLILLLLVMNLHESILQ